MIYIDEFDYCGRKLKQLVVDKSDPKHTKRILRLTEQEMKELNHHVYKVSVDWAGEYAANMSLGKADILELIKHLQSIVDNM